MAETLNRANISDADIGDELLDTLIDALNDATSRMHDANRQHDAQRAAGLYRDVVDAKEAVTNRVWELCEALREARGRISELESEVEQLRELYEANHHG